jgi:hypothetical protein
VKALSLAAWAYHCGDSIFCAVAVPASTLIRVLDWAPMNGPLSELVSVLALCGPVNSFIVLGPRTAKGHPKVALLSCWVSREPVGAGEAIRTPDPNLGKVMLYP